jgi:hypothetical protein
LDWDILDVAEGEPGSDTAPLERFTVSASFSLCAKFVKEALTKFVLMALKINCFV